MLLNHALTAMDSLTPRIRTALNEGLSCLLQKVIKQSDSLGLSDQRVECVNCLIHPCPLQMCTQSGQRQCLSDPILCEVSVRNGKLVRIVTKREYTRHRDKNSC